MARLKKISGGREPIPPDWKYDPWPMPYEVEYEFSNWRDCIDWIREHRPDILIEKMLEWPG